MATKAKKVTKNDRIDLDMTMGLIGNALLSDQGIGQMKQMMGAAKDPSAVLGQLAYHAIGAVKDKLETKGMDISPKIWVARGGVVDQTIAEAAKAIAGIGKSPQILNRNVLEAARSQVLEALHQEERHNGRPGDPNHPDNAPVPGEDDGDDSGEQAAYEGTPSDSVADNAPYQSEMPPGEAGGSHGPDTPPSGLLAGGA